MGGCLEGIWENPSYKSNLIALAQQGGSTVYECVTYYDAGFSTAYPGQAYSQFTLGAPYGQLSGSGSLVLYGTYYSSPGLAQLSLSGSGGAQSLPVSGSTIHNRQLLPEGSDLSNAGVIGSTNTQSPIVAHFIVMRTGSGALAVGSFGLTGQTLGCVSGTPKHQLTWTTATDATHYTVYRDSVALGTFSASTRQYVDQNDGFVDLNGAPQSGVTHTYTVRATNSSGATSSNAVQLSTNCSTTPPADFGVTITPASATVAKGGATQEFAATLTGGGTSVTTEQRIHFDELDEHTRVADQYQSRGVRFSSPDVGNLYVIGPSQDAIYGGWCPDRGSEASSQPNFIYAAATAGDRALGDIDLTFTQPTYTAGLTLISVGNNFVDVSFVGVGGGVLGSQRIIGGENGLCKEDVVYFSSATPIQSIRVRNSNAYADDGYGIDNIRFGVIPNGQPPATTTILGWSLENGDIGTLAPSSDGRTAVFTASQLTGTYPDLIRVDATRGGVTKSAWASLTITDAPPPEPMPELRITAWQSFCTNGEPINHLRWGTLQGVREFDIYRRKAWVESQFVLAPGGENLAATAFEFYDQSAMDSLEYDYYVNAVLTDGRVVRSNEVRFTTADCGGPTGISLTLATACPVNVPEVQLSWDALSGATYYIYKQDVLTGGDLREIRLPSGTSYVDRDVVSGRTYQYHVNARRADGWYNTAAKQVTVSCGGIPPIIPPGSNWAKVIGNLFGRGRVGNLNIDSRSVVAAGGTVTVEGQPQTLEQYGGGLSWTDVQRQVGGGVDQLVREQGCDLGRDATISGTFNLNPTQCADSRGTSVNAARPEGTVWRVRGSLTLQTPIEFRGRGTIVVEGGIRVIGAAGITYATNVPTSLGIVAPAAQAVDFPAATVRGAWYVPGATLTFAGRGAATATGLFAAKRVAISNSQWTIQLDPLVSTMSPPGFATLSLPILGEIAP
jgi:hypothetical protein